MVTSEAERSKMLSGEAPPTETVVLALFWGALGSLCLFVPGRILDFSSPCILIVMLHVPMRENLQASTKAVILVSKGIIVITQ